MHRRPVTQPAFRTCARRRQAVAEAIAEIGQVVEGYHAAKAVHFVAEKHDVDMPICGFVYDVLHRGVPLKDVVASMLAREVTPEN